MKQKVLLILFFIAIAIIGHLNCLEVEMMRNRKESDQMYNDYLSGKIKERDTSLRVPKAKVYWQGWVKYFHYNLGEKVVKPNAFFINNQFFNQKVLKKSRLSTDKGGRLSVPTKYHFYAKLMKNGINIMSSREHQYMRTVAHLSLDIIKPVPEDARYQGGIQDLGNFEEGKCIQVSTVLPIYFSDTYYSGRDRGMNEHWIICTDKLNPKKSLIDMLIKLRILRQKSFGIRESIAHPRPKKKAITNLTVKPAPAFERYTGKGAKPMLDGYWILLNDWSQCSLKCGGGKRFQQWMCVPNKPGGRPCKGKSVRVRRCNLQRCPGVTVLGRAFKKTKTTKVATPIWKVLPFSTRPQRYIKCQIRESDVLYKTNNLKFSNKDGVKVPARLVMNNHTLSLFQDEQYTNNIFTFNLHQVSIAQSMKDECCIIIRSHNRQYELCGFDKDCGTKTNPIFYKSWKNDFIMFSHNCYQPHEIGNGLEETNKLQDDFQKKISQAELEVIHQREKLLESKLDQSEQVKMEGKIKRTQSTVMKAIKKELNLEDLIKKEEQAKVDSTTQELMQKYKYEKRKKRCLQKLLKSKEEEDIKNREVKEVANQIQKLKQDAVSQVQKKRNELRKKILEIRRKAQRKNRLLEQKIQKVRGAMAADLMKANKVGDWRKCQKARNNRKLVIEYCNSNFVENYVKNSDCKDHENFCYVCCENEYGNMYIMRRDKCYSMCDDLSKKDLSNGKWVWNPNMDKK